MNLNELRDLIAHVPDFPKPGILFLDITPVLQDGKAFKSLIDHWAEELPSDFTKLVAVESRGFILGSALAQRLGKGLVLVRKKGKLPRKTYQASYELEYGSDTLEIHSDSFQEGEKVILLDDVLATGGTAKAAAELIHCAGAQLVLQSFLIEIGFLKGRNKLLAPTHSIWQS